MITKKDSVGYNVNNAVVEYVTEYMSDNRGPDIKINPLCTVKQGAGFENSVKAQAYPDVYLIEVLDNPAAMYTGTKNPDVDITYDIKEYGSK